MATDEMPAPPRLEEASTDLTILAAGGIAWMNGYDDHTLPPVRGAGNQGYHTGCHYGVMSFLAALLYRDVSGEGQFIDVSAHASCNVTTESGSYSWLVAEATVQRQTGRHASINPSMPSQVRCADGRYVNTGMPPRAEITKTALGAEEQVAWDYRADVLEAIKDARAEGYEPVVVEAGEGSTGVGEFTWPRRPCLVLGNEATGVSPLLLDACDQRVSIPMCGVKESFNVAVAFGIAAHHAATALAAANPGVVFRG